MVPKYPLKDCVRINITNFVVISANFVMLLGQFIIIYICILFSLKMECEKLAQEKTEMQRHYVMVSFKSKQLLYLLHIITVVDPKACRELSKPKGPPNQRGPEQSVTLRICIC